MGFSLSHCLLIAPLRPKNRNTYYVVVQMSYTKIINRDSVFSSFKRTSKIQSMVKESPLRRVILAPK